MTPYADFLYFGWLLYPVLPTLLLGWWGRISRWWIYLTTLAVVIIQYNGTVPVLPAFGVPELALVVGYGAYQLAIARVFLFLRTRAKSRWTFWFALLLSLAPLVGVKLEPILAPASLVGFLGISYISFRALDAIIVIQDGLVKTLPIAEYLAFLFFFPTLSSGPIDRYRRFDHDLQLTRTRESFLDDLDGAAHRIFTGFLYKFILAYLIKEYWLDPVSGGKTLLDTISYMYAYSFYLFFDFAGYTCFAVGVSYIFGIHTPENFHRPFASMDIREFWNRWNMSLSFWFRDHVYSRFLMAAARGKWFRDKYLASYIGFVITFGLIGLWHGFEPHYILYGLYHAALLIAHDLFGRWNKTHQVWKDTPVYRAAGIFITFNFVCFGFLVFSGHLFN